jgi:hypothetical protein
MVFWPPQLSSPNNMMILDGLKHRTKIVNEPMSLHPGNENKEHLNGIVAEA